LEPLFVKKKLFKFEDNKKQTLFKKTTLVFQIDSIN